LVVAHLTAAAFA